MSWGACSSCQTNSQSAWQRVTTDSAYSLHLFEAFMMMMMAVSPPIILNLMVAPSLHRPVTQFWFRLMLATSVASLLWLQYHHIKSIESPSSPRCRLYEGEQLSDCLSVTTPSSLFSTIHASGVNRLVCGD